MKKYKVVFVWRFQTPNCGDLASSPWNYLYFRGGLTSKIDISRDLSSDESLKVLDNSEVIIVGGGGLLGLDKYAEKINFILNRYSRKTFIWGAGSNWPKSKPPCDLPLLNKFYFSGLRDFPLSGSYEEFPEKSISGANYLPCASSLDTFFLSYWKGKIFQKNNQCLIKSGKQPLKVLFSSNDAGKQAQSFPSSFVKNIEKNLSQYFDCTFTSIGNSNIRMLSCLDTIESADLIFTRSYHFAYWSFLLGKPVIAIPTSSKFNSFPTHHNKYLLFASCKDVLKFISFSNYASIKEFIFGSNSHCGIHFYLQSVLLNLSAAYTLYDSLKDIDSYQIFASKYNDLLRMIPSKVLNEIGILSSKSHPESEVPVNWVDSAFTIPKIDRLMSLHMDRPLLADNAINKSVLSSSDRLADYQLMALKNIQDTLNRQVDNPFVRGYANRIKRKLIMIINSL